MISTKQSVSHIKIQHSLSYSLYICNLGKIESKKHEFCKSEGGNFEDIETYSKFDLLGIYQKKKFDLLGCYF